MRSTLLVFLLQVVASPAYSMTFKEAMSSIENHQKVAEMELKSRSTAEVANMKGSWGDPTLKVSAKNYPVDTLDPNQTPMTGVDFVLSQKVPLTSKYSDVELAFKNLSEAERWKSKSRLEGLRSALWSYLISIRKLSDEVRILRENLTWLENIIKVSQDLYSTGKQNQQAILELKIRKSELKSMVQSKDFEISEVKEMIKYIIGTPSEIDLSSVPWEILKRPTPQTDTAEKSLESNVRAKDFALTAKSKSRVPDLMVSFGYTKRSNVDENGDFVTLAATIPLPTSSVRHADFRKSLHEKRQSELALQDYRQEKGSKLAKLQLMKKRIETELEILRSETIAFADNARQVTTKSYQLGDSSYLELLQSELKLQNLRMKEVASTATLREVNLALKTSLGEELYE
ncbi:TolC family protein [Pseudobacteriovorax antillogorgiicola]|uniref:Outer membrane protein TolC n=1 Tax=Pseudobacteriovorax antillogorgiicola TaxID=1513793 RepID=A0A1Y6C1S2_9BACT|nr:TolC family protein [Pseudobacteriovorax antillogorgiicola]TCS50740.1 outer membrane protein TolC [Pseudobacteriovorax antillogorgiicola]SMF41013.1 Outer membrane protein TolC [Pseudobacteriovorax antillogorgiicola]